MEENKSGDDEEQQQQQKEDEAKDAAVSFHDKRPNVSKEMVDSDFDSSSGESNIQ